MKISLWMEYLQQHYNNWPSYMCSKGFIKRKIVGAYYLLVNKQMETYIELFSQIHLLTNQKVPETIMPDLEQSTIGALAQL